LFQHRLKNLFSSLDENNKFLLQKHPDASGNALILSYHQPVDADFEMCGMLQGMLYLNKNRELCLVSWSENDKARIEILLDKVDSFTCKLFDPKEGTWEEKWTEKKQEKPVMVSMELKWEGTKMPFHYFLPESKPITYPHSP